jgi:thiazole synthase ThiGH ThiG subunit
MPGFTTDASQAMLLDYLTGRALAYAAARNVYLGLAYTVPDSAVALDTLSEVVTAGYARVVAPWAAPIGSPMSIASNADIQFGPVTADMTTAAQYAFLTDASAGTVGTVLYVWQLVEPVLAKANKPIFVASGALTIQ